MTGAVDLHLHFGPDFLWPGKELLHSVTAAQAAQEAAAAGFAAIVLKSHDFATPALCQAVEELVPGIRVVGSITLDYPVGGLNPVAVQQALRLGARIVWLPTVNSAQDYATRGPREGYPELGLRVIDDDGELLEATRTIMDLVAEHDAILATGHISADEHYAVAREFGPRGKLVVTHAREHLAGPRLDLDQCRELADLGAVIELTALTASGDERGPGLGTDGIAEMVRAVGADRCVLSSDYGYTVGLPHPAVGLLAFADDLAAEGIGACELRLMLSETPERLLALG